ncbi:hypothetical protein HGRIS_005732 [Hohenbuehelia grisea]|uniref:Uncharacterized protein n=1 Tax=Hohenbuehelia grisea TaxID=104357 RepID=A0ABR3K002_9AGAR
MLVRGIDAELGFLLVFCLDRVGCDVRACGECRYGVRFLLRSGSYAFGLPVQLLYLLSPSARKTAPHHDSHDSHAPQKVTMKDSEGTEADVTSAVQASEAQDAPKAADGQPTADAAKAEPAEEKPKEDKPADGDATTVESKEGGEQPKVPNSSGGADAEKNAKKAGTFQDEEDSGPTEAGDARQAAKEKTTPKDAQKS